MAVNSFNAQNPPVTTKGDVFTFSTVPTRLGVGANDTVLTADSSTATGLKWAAPAGALTLSQITSGTLTSGSELSLTSLSSYDFLELRVNAINLSADDLIGIRINSNSGTNYEYNAATNRAQSAFTVNEPAMRFSLTDSRFDAMDAYQDSAQTTNHYRIRFTNCKSAGFTTVEGLYTYRWDQSGTSRSAISQWMGIYKVAEAVSSIQFTNITGATFSAGNYVLWGA